jgi:hypothetical protein
MNAMPLSIDQHMTRYPITAYLSGYVLQDKTGQRLSFHRTVSGALRKRRTLIEQEQKKCSSRSRTTDATISRGTVHAAARFCSGL